VLAVGGGRERYRQSPRPLHERSRPWCQGRRRTRIAHLVSGRVRLLQAIAAATVVFLVNSGENWAPARRPEATILREILSIPVGIGQFQATSDPAFDGSTSDVSDVMSTGR
jgi:hypothetical protein